MRPVADAPEFDAPEFGAPEVDAHEEFRCTIKRLSAKFEKMVGNHDMSDALLVLGAYNRFQRAITDHGGFDARTRAAIALVVAGDCADCRFPHTVGCRLAGWRPAQIRALHAGARIVREEKITALLAVARQVVGNAGDVDERTWRQARRTGWTVDELAELLTHVFANVFTNYLDHYARAEPACPQEEYPAWPQEEYPAWPQEEYPAWPQEEYPVRRGDREGRVESWLRISGTSGRTA